MRRSALISTALASLLILPTLLIGQPAVAAPVSTPAVDAPAPDRPQATTESEPTLVEPEAEATTREAARALAADFVDVDIPSRAEIRTHRVTIALVAPQGTIPGGFSTADAVRSLQLVDGFYDRETGGAIRFELERVIDWQAVDEPIGCTNTGGLHDWVSRKTGWTPGPGKHLVVMVPGGDPCPGWANGEQPGDPDDGGRTFQPGPDAYLLAHELGHNLSLPHAFSVQCGTTRDYPATPLPADCRREEYGNRTDVMGDSWAFLPLSAPTLARLGTLPNTRQPVCGAPRTAVLDTLGAGPAGQRALTWTDPQDSSLRYWLQYSDRADVTSDGGAYRSPWAVARTVSGVQVLRSNPDQPYGGDLLERPGDPSEANEFVVAGETATLNSGMSVRVDRIDAATRRATVTVTVPCTEYVGNIAPLGSAVSASYASPWTAAESAVDDNTGSTWGTWPRVGEQSLELRWPADVTVSSASVLFAADAADADGRGLIPARSWRVEHLIDGSWVPVTGAVPATPGRERDTLNTVTFAPVVTTALRLTFTAWGANEYGGSTGVAEVAVGAVTPAASLEVRGTAQSVPTATVKDLGQSVVVRDARGGGLSGRSVVFTITGPATFETGGTTATVASGADGAAAVPRVRTGGAAGTVTIIARSAAITAELPRTTVAVGASVTAKATTRIAAGKVVLTVSATNTGTTPADLSVVTPYGSASAPQVLPGKTVSKAFSTGKSSIPAGTAQVTAVAGGSRVTVPAPYPRT
ncbi:hypothetical protein [Microbacterium sp. VKM Ac-2923]|uniref:hypothetical protein n=1 Tax=Microbacterium sp. VKM Ac-2923 TaxID=2929476 RepID=UPI001FB4E203|nr:hypothetical protein [Microbacterium sp. VKM Ac-2923]MCJ1708663.1 hypothetical protein [Microbacterium sp. VKM Ac-2923]